MSEAENITITYERIRVSAKAVYKFESVAKPPPPTFFVDKAFMSAAHNDERFFLT